MLKKARQGGRKGPAVFAFIVVAIFFVFGAYLSFSVYPGQAREQARVAAVPMLDMSGFSGLANGEEFGISGRLDDNRGLDDHDFVALLKYRWEVEEEDDGYEGEWVEFESAWPVLGLAVQGGRLRIDSGKPPRLMGPMEEIVVPVKQRLMATYENSELGHGSLRIRGVRNGDTVTLIGSKTGIDRLKPSYFFLGTRADLLASLARNARAMQIIGFVFMAMALVILAVVIVKK